jgi:hypothetical protein
VGLGYKAAFVALYAFSQVRRSSPPSGGDFTNLVSGVQHSSYKSNPFGTSVRVEFPVSLPFSNLFPSRGTASSSMIAKGALVTSVRIGRFAARMEFEL